MFSRVHPNAWAIFRLPSGTLKPIQVVPNTIISLGKYGSFQSNLILDRPYNLTYELLDRQEGQSLGGLRIVPSSELHADIITEEDTAGNGSSNDWILGGDGVEYTPVGEDGELILRSNRETIDDSTTQMLTQEEIEALKRDSLDAGKDVIAKLIASHTAIDQKTAFSLAKYKLLKSKKYLRQFTILPLDVALLTQWLIEDKDPSRIMEMREELLALAGCWGNVHFSENPSERLGDEDLTYGRWLVIDEVGGLLVAALAERMGILYPVEEEENTENTIQKSATTSSVQNNGHRQLSRQSAKDIEPRLAQSNTITLIHSNTEPNLSLLKYFSFTPNAPVPDQSHPLATHLKTISWLQLLSPEEDLTYSTLPPDVAPEELASWKSGKRGTYFRKRRRYTRTRTIVDETRAGGFNGLVVASYMDPTGIMKNCIPLLRGGASIVIYSPTVEPLSKLADLYSMSRRTAFITSPPEELQTLNSEEGNDKIDPIYWQGNEDFPLNPTLLLGVTVQTSRVRKWQVLPGRTHPLMTGRGGTEGYLFTATKVIPAKGRVAARGKFAAKRRRVDGSTDIKDGDSETAEPGFESENNALDEEAVISYKSEDVLITEES